MGHLGVARGQRGRLFVLARPSGPAGAWHALHEKGPNRAGAKAAGSAGWKWLDGARSLLSCLAVRGFWSMRSFVCGTCGACLLVSASASAGVKSSRPCQPHGAHVVSQSRLVVVLSRPVSTGVGRGGARYSACWKPTGRRTILFMRPYPEPNSGCRVFSPLFAARWVAMTETCFVTVSGDQASQIVLDDARHGRRFQAPLPHRWHRGLPPAFFVTASVVNRCGVLAYSWRYGNGVVSRRDRHLRVWRPHRAPVLLFKGVLEDRSLRISRRHVSWSTNGHAKRAQIPWRAC